MARADGGRAVEARGKAESVQGARGRPGAARAADAVRVHLLRRRRGRDAECALSGRRRAGTPQDGAGAGR